MFGKDGRATALYVGKYCREYLIVEQARRRICADGVRYRGALSPLALWKCRSLMVCQARIGAWSAQ
jgi:hypothetical protein